MSRPALRLLIGFSPGSASDIVARLVAPHLSRLLGRAVRVESHLGKSGENAGRQLAQTAPDGTTLLIATLGTHALKRALHPLPVTDPDDGCAPVSLLATAPLVVTAANDLGVSSIAELVARARAAPDELEFASSAIGGAPHLAGELFCRVAGVRMRHRPYLHTEALYVDLESGAVPLTFNNIMSALPLARAGRAVALAVTGARRSPMAPDVPTVAESGIRDYEVINWVGVVARVGTPSRIVADINSALTTTIEEHDVRARLSALGMEAAAGSPEAFALHIRTETIRWAGLVAAIPGPSPRSGAQVLP
ncbi:MAG: hypothetical protein H7125_13180 [Proteobacteria bacterium]|nr:hypothetical protein [Burkholderiales bacterium]